MVTLDHTSGQFGNLLFQIAATMSVARDNNCPLALPPIDTLTKSASAQAYFQTVYQRIAEGIEIGKHKRASLRCYEEPSFRPTFIPIPYKKHLFVVGYFQNELHFKHHYDWIRSCFAITEPVEAYLQDHFSELLSHPKLVGIHVRTYYPDWLLSGCRPDVYKAWLAPDMEFFRQAIERCDPDSLFVVCSDHPRWCKENFGPIARNFIFIEGNDFVYDFFLLTKCSGLIIAGSTFCWWAAYLSDCPKNKIFYRNPFSGFNYHSDLSDNPDWLAITMPEGPPPTPVFH